MTTPSATPVMRQGATRDEGPDPIALVKNVTALVRSTGLYPAGHTVVQQALQALDDTLRPALDSEGAVRLDVIGGDVHLDGRAYRQESMAHPQAVVDFTSLGLDSLHVDRGVTRDELAAMAAVLAGRDAASADPIAPVLEARGVRHVSVGRLIPLDTRWRAREWPDRPQGPLDPDYAESLRLAEEAIGGFAEGRAPGARAVRDLLQLLVAKVAHSQAALGQILAVKQYENHTYCHSVNVAILSLLLARHAGLSEASVATVVEGALLHDVGKTRVPVAIIKKPAALSKRERRIIERHPVIGAAMLTSVPGLGPLTPTIALEHHRYWNGSGGYPEVGAHPPHLLSQIVMIADVYEAATGARSYRPAVLPEQACLILAKLAGERLNPHLVRAFLNAVTFFPLGSLVRTTLDEVGTVIRTTPGDPLHPVIATVDEANPMVASGREIDTSRRDATGAYLRHIAETLRPSTPTAISPAA
jgi:putative nucleotidyltransferase with HDIG domain